MKTFLLAVACALAWSDALNAQDTFAKVLDEMLPTFTKLGDTLGTIKNNSSADEVKQAKTTIKEIAAKLLELKARGEKLGEPMGKQKDELEKKYKAKLEEGTRKLAAELLRIKTDVKGGDAIVKEVSESLVPLSKKKKP